MMTAGAGVVIWAIMGVMMLGMITGGHQEGPQPHRAATTPTPAPPASRPRPRPRAAEPAAPTRGGGRCGHWRSPRPSDGHRLGDPGEQAACLKDAAHQ